MAEEQGDLLAGGPLTDIGAEALDAIPADKWEKALVEFIEVGEAALRRDGLGEEEAFKQARSVVLGIAEFRGGRLFYLPKGERLLKALRDMEIFRRAKAGNIEALAEEHGLDVIHVYRIIREQRKLHITRTQRELPLGES